MNVSINASENGLLLFVLPTQPLVAGSRYVLTLTADITDTSGNALEAVSFEFTTVSAPAISAVTPTEGPVGTAVTILGQNFDAQAQMNVVKFGTTAALVLRWGRDPPCGGTLGASGAGTVEASPARSSWLSLSSRAWPRS